MKIFLLSMSLIGLGYAQTPSPSASPAATTTPISQFWRAVLPGGIYRVRLDRIQSVSTHEYTIEPLMRVTEFTIETSGPVVTRFYFMETTSPQSPVTIGQSGIDALKQKAEELSNRLAGDMAPWKKVVKIYPVTTHAHTVEYRVTNKEDISKLMESAENAWNTGRGEEIKLN